MKENKKIPIFFIHPLPVSKDYFSSVTVIYKGITYKAKGKIRGAQSAFYPKKSYTLKFSKKNLFSDPDNPLFTNHEKLILHSNFDDNSYIRNRLAYFIWNSLENDFKINSFSAEIYGNGSFKGLYTVTEFIEKSYFVRNGKSSGGNLYKGESWDANLFTKADLFSGIEKKEGYPEAGDEGSYSDMKLFIEILNNNKLSESEFSKIFSQVADVQSYYDWWFLVSLIKGFDSIAKNTYHYHDLSASGKWYFIPWDFNYSFGQNAKTERSSPNFDHKKVSGNAVFKRLILNPNFHENYRKRYTRLLMNDLSLSNLINMIDKIYEEIHVSAKKDFSKWEKSYRDYILWNERKDFTNFDDEVNYIKKWITNQYQIVLKDYLLK